MNFIYHDLVIDASPKQVFDYFSEPIHLNNWWTKDCQGFPQLDHAYRLYFAPEYDWTAKVSICKPNNHFELSMTKADQDWTSTKPAQLLLLPPLVHSVTPVE